MEIEDLAKRVEALEGDYRRSMKWIAISVAILAVAIAAKLLG